MTTTASSGSRSPGSAKDRTALGGLSAKLLSPSAHLATRVLSEPRFGLAVLIGAVAGTPGALYITAPHQLVTGKSSTAVQAVAVVVFVLIEFSLVIIPFVFLVVRPEATKAQVKRVQDWLMSHAPQLMAGVALFAGGYMVISGLIRLS
jgi:hypothetical protein